MGGWAPSFCAVSRALAMVSKTGPSAHLSMCHLQLSCWFPGLLLGAGQGPLPSGFPWGRCLALGQQVIEWLSSLSLLPLRGPSVSAGF